MLARGIDQILPSSCDPRLHENYVKDARAYTDLAVGKNGALPPKSERSPTTYVWGHLMAILDRYRPHLRLINLETAMTARGVPWPGKAIHYRMHPANCAVLSALPVDGCSLANNHTLDWGYDGLTDTLAALNEAGIAAVGAGRNAAEAAAVKRFDIPDSEVSVFFYALGHTSAGVYPEWAATAGKPGVNLLPGLSTDHATAVITHLNDARRACRDSGRRRVVTIVSVHWGSNWGYEIEAEFVAFAERLVRDGDVDCVHGHSSHHPRGIQLYRGRPIMYGCGDLINDYEGIGGAEFQTYRDYLGLACFLDVDFADSVASSSSSSKTGPGEGETRSVTLRAVPTRIRRLSIDRPSDEESAWLLATIQEQCTRLGTTANIEDGVLRIG